MRYMMPFEPSPAIRRRARAAIVAKAGELKRSLESGQAVRLGAMRIDEFGAVLAESRKH